MAVCRFCLCRIDPTKVQVATYVQGTHTRRRIRVARAIEILLYRGERGPLLAVLAEDTQRHPQCPSVTIYNARCAS
jgi:hypothetical protein